MKLKFASHRGLVTFIVIFVLQAWTASAPVTTPTVAPTYTPEPPKPTSTVTLVSSLFASSTPRPTQKPNLMATLNAQKHKATRTPNLGATQQIGEWNTDIQKYFDLGYLLTTNGKITTFHDFKEEWAQLGWYQTWPLNTQDVSDFSMSGHLKWSSAYRSADLSGCGFTFAGQDDSSQYAVFLDRATVYFVQSDERFFIPWEPHVEPGA